MTFVLLTFDFVTRVEEIMTDLSIYDRVQPGDFVEHNAAPGVVWEVLTVDPYMDSGPQATLRYVGGDPITYEQMCRVFNVFGPASRVCRSRELVEANPMLTLAAVAQHR